jgi:hypothetical protein
MSKILSEVEGKIKTSDLWQSAYVLARGGELIAVELNGNGRKRATFIFSGPEIEKLSREFRSGQAVCNVTRLRASMIHLKEVMFSRING